LAAQAALVRAAEGPGTLPAAQAALVRAAEAPGTPLPLPDADASLVRLRDPSPFTSRSCFGTGAGVSTTATPLRRALVSVSDKSQLEVLAEILIAHKLEVLSTGGTHRALERCGVAVVKVSEFTGAPEILDGRVKTLHPRIHGGILALPTDAHQRELE